jgi:tetratricopeptide (TPR) repeat protein
MRCFVFFSSLLSMAAQELPQDLVADKLMAQRRYPQAEAEYSELLRTRPGESEILVRRGAVRMQLGRYKEARTDLEAALSASRLPAGLANVQTLLGTLEQIEGRYAHAIRHHLIALELKQESYGPRDPALGTTWNRLGEAYLASDSLKNAENALAAAVAILTASPGYEFHLCLAHANAGRVFLQQRRYVEAAGSFEQARQAGTEESGCTVMIAAGLGQLYYAQRDFSQAERYFRESICIGRRIWPDGHSTTGGSLHGLARTAAARNQFAEARGLFYRCLDVYEQVLGPTHPDVRAVLLDLEDLLRAAHHRGEARLIAARIHRDSPASLGTVSLDALRRR